MAANADETQGSALDTAKLILALAIVGGGIYGYYHFADQSNLYRVLGLVAAVVVAFLVLLQTALGRRMWAGMVDARTEVRKVVWPTRQETLQTTLIIFVLVLIVGIFIWLLDTFLGWATRSLIG